MNCKGGVSKSWNEEGLDETGRECHLIISIYSLVYSHTHGCHAHCTWWHNVNVIK